MILRLDNKDQKISEQIVMLQQASYKIEADLIGFDKIPPLLESIEDIRKSEEIFYGYFVHGSLAGIVSYKLEDTTLDIYKVAVHPEFFRKGIAKQLISFLEENCDGNKIIVSTAVNNIPAVALYRSMGFNEVNQQEIEEGLYIINFEKYL